MTLEEEEWHHVEHALREPEPWTLMDELIVPRSDPRALRELAARLEEERAAAREQLEPLLESPERFEAARVDHDARFQSSAVVEVLTWTAESLHDDRPEFARVISDAAVRIAMNLAGVEQLRSRSLLGCAHLARGKVLFIIGRYRDAEDELRLANDAFAADRRATDWDFARVALMHANVCVETDRLDEALEQASRAATRFGMFGDTARYLAARMVEGHVLFMNRDYGNAARVLDRVAEQARRIGDALHRARACQSAGNCYIELGEPSRAEARLREALALWNELGLEVERIRTNWSLGVLAKARGDLDGAIVRLEDAYRAFEAAGVVNDAAMARLELAEVLLLVGRAADVREVLRGVVVRFTGEGLMRNANVALAYLREAVESGAVEQRVIQHVRRYLEQLPSHADSRFVALA